jgi:competence protein ComFC
VADIHPARIPGRWRDGYALDVHTVSSAYLGDDEYGRPQYDTKRSELGDLLYRLKYRGDASVVPEIADTAASFVRTWNPRVELVVPVPASKPRAAPPVPLLGAALAERLGLPFAPDCLTRTRQVHQLKDVRDYDERLRLLAGTYAVDRATVENRRVLLVDDLFRSGATMNTAAALLYDQGGAVDVYALTITRTRSNR